MIARILPTPLLCAAALAFAASGAHAQQAPHGATPSAAPSAPATPGAAPQGTPSQGTPAQGASSHGISIMGLGGVTCESWLQLHQLGAGDAGDQWLMGYLSAIAAATSSNYLAGLTLSDLSTRVQDFCKGNQKAILAVAGTEIAQQLNAPIGRNAQRK